MRAKISTAHYVFDYDPQMVHPVKSTNKDGKSFHVMAGELIEFMATVVREQQADNLERRSDLDVLGFNK